MVDWKRQEEKLCKGLSFELKSVMGDNKQQALVKSLIQYGKELEFWNQQINLVGRLESDFYSRHLLDCLVALPIFLKQIKQFPLDYTFKAVDVGSGGGLPGIVLALALENSHWTLVERSGKKAGFLRNAIALLGLKDRVLVVEKSVEELSCTFDLVTFRAFRQFKDFFPILKRLVSDNGILFAYKGKIDSAKAEVKAFFPALKAYQILPFEVPDLNEERCGFIWSFAK